MRYRRLSHAVAIGAVVLGIGMFAAPTQAAQSVRTPRIHCQDLALAVTLAAAPQTVYGTLCTPPGARTIQILIPGASYNSTYWDFPIAPETRSYRLAMNNAGYATLALDRLGTGRSTHPPSSMITAFSQASVIHQVVQAVRTGTGTPRFDNVILGGHSVGSTIAIIEAATYRDVDGVLVTGFTHGVNPLGAAPILATLIPAMLDPKFSGRGYDLGYLTTRSGTRFGSFHQPGSYHKNVADADEATKDVFAPGEVVDTVLISKVLPYTRKIPVPVLLVMGHDPAFCGLLAPNCRTATTLRSAEARHYSPAAQLKTFLVPNFGHSLNLSPTAPTYHAAVVHWANTTIGH